MTDTTDREIRFTRTVAAPRALVFELWTRAEHLDRWWGPRGFQTTTASLDMRPGGAWIYKMKHAEYGEFDNRIRYAEVVPGERLAYEHDAGVDDDPNGFFVTVTFTDAGGQTEVAMRSVFRTAAGAAAARQFGAIEGGRQTLERLGELLAEAAESDLVLTRVLQAPRALVWKAWTEAERLSQWWGPAGMELTVARLDLRPGGVFHYGMRAPGMPAPMWGSFVYGAVHAPARLEFVSSFCDADLGLARHPMAATWPLEVFNVLTLEEHDGVTTQTLRGRPINASDAEKATFLGGRAGMQQGFAGTFAQLEAYLRRA